MDYPVRTLTGDAVIDRLVLTGWGTVTAAVTSLSTWTDRGRMWWFYTASTRDISFYRRNSTTVATDKVCSGTVSTAGLVTLAQANTSGISGTAEVTDGDFATGALVNPEEDSTGDIIVSYADENDLIDAAQGVPNVLDSSSKWNAQLVRFEAILLRTRLDFDGHVARKLAGLASYDNRNNVVLCDIRNPKQLAKAHAYYTVAEMMEHRQGTDPQRMDATDAKRKRAMELLNALTIDLDTNADRTTDNAVNFSIGRVRRA